MKDQNSCILEVNDLNVYFEMYEGVLKAVDGLNFKLKKGRTMGIVGESGCGKSVTSQAILGIVPKPGKVSGQILLHEKNGEKTEKPIDLIKLAPMGDEIRNIRGGTIGMIFQEPMKAFSPIHTIGNQIMEGILIHTTKDPRKAKLLAIDALKKVEIPNAEQRFNEYPHQLSGGMRQRAMIAMALSCNPDILIADEPTTALDVTIQAQVLELINELKRKNNTSVIFITHDLGVIAEMADEVATMYLGKIVEFADVETTFHDPQHPYTRALLESIPSITREAKTKLFTIEGTVPFPMNLRPGCGFYARCPLAIEGKCNTSDIPLIEVKTGHHVRCIVAADKNKERIS